VVRTIKANQIKIFSSLFYIIRRVGKLHTKYLGPNEAQHAFDLVYEEISWELTEWKEVPTEAILKVSNPTGSPVICHSAIYEIWCFVPDNQY
jgi:hypothetical protein